MSYKQSCCECEDCGHEISDDEYVYCENCKGTEPATCEKCQREIEDPNESVLYCENCWNKHTTSLDEQLSNIIEELEEVMSTLPGNFTNVVMQYKNGEKNLDAIYTKMTKVQEGFQALKTQLITAKDQTAIAVEEPGLKELFEPKEE